MEEVETHNCGIAGCVGKILGNTVLINCKPLHLLFPCCKSTQKQRQSLLLITKCPWNVSHTAGCCQVDSVLQKLSFVCSSTTMVLNFDSSLTKRTKESWGQGALPEWVRGAQERRDAPGNHAQLYQCSWRRPPVLVRQAGMDRCVGGGLF